MGPPETGTGATSSQRLRKLLLFPRGCGLWRWGAVPRQCNLGMHRRCKIAPVFPTTLAASGRNEAIVSLLLRRLSLFSPRCPLPLLPPPTLFPRLLSLFVAVVRPDMRCVMLRRPRSSNGPATFCFRTYVVDPPKRTHVHAGCKPPAGRRTSWAGRASRTRRIRKGGPAGVGTGNRRNRSGAARAADCKEPGQFQFRSSHFFSLSLRARNQGPKARGRKGSESLL